MIGHQKLLSSLVRTHMVRTGALVSIGKRLCYHNVYRHSIEDPIGFWEEHAKQLHWTKPWSVVLDEQTVAPASLWFPDGEINMCHNALDVHVAQGRGDQPAIIFESAYTKEKRVLTYNALLEQVSRFSGTGCWMYWIFAE